MTEERHYVDDPHGVVETFRRTYEANLPIMSPDAAARQAMATLDGYLRGSKFLDVSAKTEKRQYVRVDKTPEGVKR